MSVRRHIIGGADVLDQIEFPWEVARIIREQFEHRDGSGFPNGLTGSQMLIESQILFMVNMFISLTQSQNYRDPYTVDQAMEMMSEQAGLWFDQELFAVLTDFVEDNLRRLRLIKRSLNDIMITNYITFT
jgi:HD-GYP domain-containing protein (c-di-GMP phosphodiesterase class II)